MNKHHWLSEQIEFWLRDELISAEQAAELRARYPAPADGRSWGRLVFAALGAVIFGLGVILLIAYNWQQMHRFAKLALIAAGLLAAHGAGYLLWPRGGRRGMAESLHVLGTMLLGAGIWLVAQIYHLNEHYPDAFLVWCLGALALAWTLPSVAHGLLAAGLLVGWAWFEAFDFHRVIHAAPWLAAAGLIPLAWWLRSRMLLFAGTGVFLLLFAICLGSLETDLLLPALWMLSGAIFAAARLARLSAFAGADRPLALIGGGGVLLSLYLASFHDITGELTGLRPEGALEWAYFGFAVACLMLAWLGYGAGRAFRLEERRERLESALVAATQGILLLSTLGLFPPLLAWAGFNLTFLAHGAIFIRGGTAQQKLPPVALGCSMVAALVLARFADLFDSLVLRAVVFLLLGAGLLAVGWRYTRQAEARHA